MLITPHFMVGAAIAAHTPEFWPAVLAALTSHFVLDTIPHRDTIGKFDLKPANLVILFVDVTMVSIILYWLIAARPDWLYILIVGMCATVPDGLSGLGLFWPGLLQLPILKEFHYWHTETIHHRYKPLSWFWGIFTQVVIVVIAVILIRL